MLVNAIIYFKYYNQFRMIQQKRDSRQNNQKQSIKIVQRQHYGCLAKIFCCKCIHCCQDFDISLLTSNNRKEVFEKMIKRYINKLHKQQELSMIMDPFFILVALLLGQQSQIYSELMAIITNQSQPTVFSKQDLEFYIPELCTYLVFHEELKNIQLQKLLIRACKVDIHFSLKYYFYMKSLQIIKNDDEIIKYEEVNKYNCHFRNMINNYYQAHRQERQIVNMMPQQECSIEMHKHMSEKENIHDDKNEKGLRRMSIGSSAQISQNHKVGLVKRQSQNITISSHSMSHNNDENSRNKESELCLKQKLKRNKIRFLQQTNIYQPFISKPIKFPKGIFESTVNFFSDLIELGTLLIPATDRKQQLLSYLQKINKRLPATIYIPFTNQCYQDLNIISVVFSESKVFATKQRAPYYVCFEAFFNPTYNEGISRDKKIRSDLHIKKEHLKKPHLFQQGFSPSKSNLKKQEWLRESQISIKFDKQQSQVEQKDLRNSNLSNGSGGGNKRSSVSSNPSTKKSWSSFFKLDKIKSKIPILKDKISKDENEDAQQEQWTEKKSENTTEQMDKSLVMQQVDSNNIEELFGQSSQKQYQRISEASTFSDLPGYTLIHVIIKSHDDLRQQCFAMQLLQQFDKIFRMEGLPAKLSPYEVLPLSHNSGIIEFIRDAITIDQLRKKNSTLKAVLNTKSKKKNFLNSLVAYSLITYFLQVKDRHNGNIMIKSDGSILHIDYGFFMTNMPGKGVQLQKNLPFKLTNQYVEALGGLDSKNFGDFRILFYRAFDACRKHQHRIIILTKLMYSSFGKTMPCFIKGNQAIQKLQQRFNPPGLKTDAQISFFCQNLINSSVDNWRSRWYDKWQYYMQGILY